MYAFSYFSLHFTYCRGSLLWGFLRPDFGCTGSNSECSQTLLTPLLLSVCTIWSNVGLHVPFFNDFTWETWRPKLLWMLQHSSHNRIPLLTDAHVGSVKKKKKIFQTDSQDSTTQSYVIRNSCYKKNHLKSAKLFLQKYNKLEYRPTTSFSSH